MRGKLRKFENDFEKLGNFCLLECYGFHRNAIDVV